MAVYLNSNKVRVLMGDTAYSIRMQFTLPPATNDLLLASSNDLIFQDVNNLYLAVKTGTRLRSLDNFTLKDSNALYITTYKESE